MPKKKYDIKKIFEEGCTETYIFKDGEKLRRISKDDWGHVCSPMELIELLIDELNNNS